VKKPAIPTARILLSIRNRKWTVWEALAELIDNSFGEQRGAAGAVWINWNKQTRVMTVLDNGVGMDNVSDLFTLGKGAAAGGKDIGYYGVGGSEALLWLGDKATVYNLRDGKVSRGAADWKRCMKRNEFPEIDDDWRDVSSANCPTELQEQGGGVLISLNIHRGIGFRTDIAQDQIARLYGVGLRSGRRITWTTDGVETQLRPWNPGPLRDVIDADVVLTNGLRAHVHAGRADNLSVENSKVSLNYVYRRIEATSDGFGRPVRGALANVDLAPEWLPYLTTTKSGIADAPLRAELMAKVAEVLKPLVEKLAEDRLNKVFEKVKFSLQRRLEGAFKVAAQGEGDTEPTPKERPGVAKEFGSGPDTPPKRDVPGIAVIEVEKTTDKDIDGKLCHVVMDNHAVVAYVNQDHPKVRVALESEPANQLLLEDLLIVGLSKELVAQDALVRMGVFSRSEHTALKERFDGDVLEIFPHVIRRLTDAIVDDAA
jgi:hypothetical protein